MTTRTEETRSQKFNRLLLACRCQKTAWLIGAARTNRPDGTPVPRLARLAIRTALRERGVAQAGV